MVTWREAPKLGKDVDQPLTTLVRLDGRRSLNIAKAEGLTICFELGSPDDPPLTSRQKRNQFVDNEIMAKSVCSGDRANFFA